jgi:predicted class III extradiol MEMO1 family dioxygenase
MKTVMVGDITVRMRDDKNNPLECLNSAFKHFESNEQLPTKIAMNDKTFQVIANADHENIVVYPDEESACGWGIWYAALEIKDSIPDNKFVLSVEYDMRDTIDEDHLHRETPED